MAEDLECIVIFDESTSINCEPYGSLTVDLIMFSKDVSQHLCKHALVHGL